PAAHIRALYCRHYWGRAGGVLRGLCACLVWPFGFAVYAALLTSRNGTYVRTLTGKGIGRQLGEQLALALRESMVPYWYYMFEIYDDHRRGAASLYLQRYETKGFIFNLLQPRSEDGMQDKSVFSRRCHDSGVKAVPVLFILKGGEIITPEGG